MFEKKFMIFTNCDGLVPHNILKEKKCHTQVVSEKTPKVFPPYVTPQTNNPPTLFWIQVHAATHMCKQTAAIQQCVPTSLCA